MRSNILLLLSFYISFTKQNKKLTSKKLKILQHRNVVILFFKRKYTYWNNKNYTILFKIKINLHISTRQSIEKLLHCISVWNIFSYYLYFFKYLNVSGSNQTYIAIVKLQNIFPKYCSVMVLWSKISPVII